MPSNPALDIFSGEFNKQLFQEQRINKYLRSNIRQPTLGLTPPPRGVTARNRDPFDFFGTLFSNPATAGLNPLIRLNQTV